MNQGKKKQKQNKKQIDSGGWSMEKSEHKNRKKIQIWNTKSILYIKTCQKIRNAWMFFV